MLRSEMFQNTENKNIDEVSLEFFWSKKKKARPIKEVINDYVSEVDNIDFSELQNMSEEMAKEMETIFNDVGIDKKLLKDPEFFLYDLTMVDRRFNTLPNILLSIALINQYWLDIEVSGSKVDRSKINKETGVELPHPDILCITDHFVVYNNNSYYEDGISIKNRKVFTSWSDSKDRGRVDAVNTFKHEVSEKITAIVKDTYFDKSDNVLMLGDSVDGSLSIDVFKEVLLKIKGLVSYYSADGNDVLIYNIDKRLIVIDYDHEVAGWRFI